MRFNFLAGREKKETEPNQWIKKNHSNAYQLLLTISNRKCLSILKKNWRKKKQQQKTNNRTATGKQMNNNKSNNNRCCCQWQAAQQSSEHKKKQNNKKNKNGNVTAIEFGFPRRHLSAQTSHSARCSSLQLSTVNEFSIAAKLHVWRFVSPTAFF